MHAVQESKPHPFRYYLRGMLLASGGNGVAMVMGTALAMVAARWTTKAELGAYFLVMLISYFSGVLGDLGLRTSAVRFMSIVIPEERPAIAHYLITLRCASLGLIVLLLLGALPILTRIWASQEFAEVVYLSLGILPSGVLFGFGTDLLVGLGLFAASSTLIAVINTVRVLIAVPLLYFGYGVPGMLWSMVVVQGIGVLIIWYLLPFRMVWTWRHPRRREMIGFSGWLQGVSILALLNTKSIDALLTTYLGTVALAAYGAAMTIPSIFQRVFETIRPVLLGYISCLADAAAERSVAAVRIMTGFLAVGFSLLMIFATPLVTLLYSHAYADAALLMQILCVRFCFDLVGYYLELTLIGLGRTAQIWTLGLIRFGYSTVLALIFIPRYGAPGATLAFLAASVIGNAAMIFAVGHRTPSLTAALLKAFLGSALPLVALLVVLVWLPTSWLLSAGLVPAFIASLLASGGVRLRDLKMVWLHARNDTGPAPKGAAAVVASGTE